MDDDDQPVGPSKPVHRIDDVSSLLDLQTEFLKRKKATVSSFPTYTDKYVNKPKNNILALTKEEKRSKQEASDKRLQRIKQNEDILHKEEFDRQRQRKILEEKQKTYERLTRGESLVHEDGRTAEFLVDFNLKKKEMEGNELKGHKESDDSINDINPLVVHYDHSEEKGRVFGPSHVPLPTLNEDARLKKIAEIKEMTEQTRIERAKHKKAQSEKRAEERRRLNKIRIEHGLPPEISSESDEDAEADVCVSNTSVQAGDQSSTSIIPPKMPRIGVREWDRGKVGYMKWINSQRDERDDEFKPPSFYYK